jgi:ribosomal protein L9
MGQELDKRHIMLEEPLRHLGEFKVPVRVSADLQPTVTVVIEREE